MSKSRKMDNSSTSLNKEIQGTCFVIMPFRDNFDEYYDMIYRPAIMESGLQPMRTDDLFRPGTIVSDIWEMTQSAKLILADLSEKNPNVFYELGLAHAIAKPAILVSENLQDVPFDLQSLRVISYNKDRHNWGQILYEKIKASIFETLASPMNSIPATYLKVQSTAKPYNVAEHEKQMLNMRQELNLIHHELRMLREPEPAPTPTRTRTYSAPRKRSGGTYGGGVATGKEMFHLAHSDYYNLIADWT